MKKILLLVLCAIMFMVMSCEDVQPTSDSITTAKAEKLQRESDRQTGLPGIKNFQEKKLMKMIYELRDQENVVCHAYLYNAMKGTVGQYLGKCLGYGMPYSTQYSNPEKLFYRSGGHGRVAVTIPQAEPNGLFMPDGLSATWLMLLDSEGKPHPTYIEPEIIVSPFKLHGAK